MVICYGDAEFTHRTIELPDGLNLDQARLRAHLNRRSGEGFFIVDDEGDVLYSYEDEGR